LAREGGEAANGQERPRAVHDVLVHLVGDDEHPRVAPHHLGDRLHLARREDLTRRVVRRVEDDKLGPRPDGRVERVGVQTPLRLLRDTPRLRCGYLPVLIADRVAPPARRAAAAQGRRYRPRAEFGRSRGRRRARAVSPRRPGRAAPVGRGLGPRCSGWTSGGRAAIARRVTCSVRNRACEAPTVIATSVIASTSRPRCRE